MRPPPLEVLRVFLSLSYDDCLSLIGGVKGALDDSPAGAALDPALRDERSSGYESNGAI